MHLHVLSGSCGSKHTNIITKNGELYSWGLIDFINDEVNREYLFFKNISIRP